ncbi:serine/arginine repetitive matrix protein 1-like [Dermacentor silvarum]|uniref:serine/arginine repetitive matrix protein 1-like n=1 Tax=Dermacentor silvarum TaxID=543639 RepID=UPI002100996C|nr:serine/arginine repetitive matrix protein 1-like [Dermacentor silvarum]
MSDWSDTSEAADSDTSSSMPRFSRPWEEKKKAAAKRAKREYSSPWMRYYNLSAKQRRAEDKRIADKLAAVEAEFREVEKFELTYVPFEYRTRGSSLSPRTPPPKEAAPASDAVLPASPLPSTSKAGLPEPPREAQQPDDRRVKFRLVDGSVVSSSDDEDTTYVSRVSRKRLVYSTDDDANARSPPTASERRVHDVSSDDDDVSGRVARLPKVRETPGALPCAGIREEDVDREGGDAAERASSSSLTRADIIRKRKERIARQRSHIEEICSGYRSSSDEASRKRSFRRTPAVTPRDRSRAVPGRRSHVRRALWSRDARAIPSPTSSVEEPLRVQQQGQTPPSFKLSSAGSSTSSIGGPSARTSRVWHSTPHGPPRRRFSSLRDVGASGSAPLRGTLALAASADRPQRTGSGFLQVLDRGQTLVITKQPELQEGTCFGEQPPTEPPSAAASPASRRHDESSATRRSVDAAEWWVCHRTKALSNLREKIGPLVGEAVFR